MSPFELERIVSRFQIEGVFRDALPFGSGHINDTYRVVNRWSKFPDYLLQRVNHDIFKDVPGLIDNIVHVTGHLRSKLSAGDQVLTLISAKNGKYYHKDEEGRYWRLYLFVNNMRSYDLVTTEKMAYESGKALGRFQNQLADLDADRLNVVLPYFHNIHFRLKQFEEAVRKDVAGRLKEVIEELTFVRVRRFRMAEIERLGENGMLPLRVTHNDTKINNVLFDTWGRARCIVDLDTVMPGYAAYDFGDAVRTLISTAPEDEADLDKIDLNMDYFEAFAHGFLSETARHMDLTEIRSLALGVVLLPFIMGLRFLTDYINGDPYYKVAFPAHNIQRARAQFRLVQKLEAVHPEIYATIMNAAGIKTNFNQLTR